MKKPQNLAIVTLAAALTLAVALPIAPVFAADGDPAPKATVPEPVHDFGELVKGAEVSHDFEIRNVGDAPLEITRVAPACGCTVAQFDQVIAPGESGQVRADIDTSTLLGAVSRRISVYTNDPANPILRLTFKADVQPQIFMNPGYARYQVTRGEQIPGTIKQVLYTGDGVDYEISKVETPWPAMEVTVRDARDGEKMEYESSMAGPQYVVEMKLLHNELPVGPLADEVVLHTTHPSQKIVRIPVSGFVRPTMWVTPNEVELGQIEVEKDDPVDYSVVLQNFLAAPVEVTAVESDWGEAMEGEALVVNEGHKFQVRLKITSDMPKGPFEGTVRIRTNSDVMPVVEVPVAGTVLKPHLGRPPLPRAAVRTPG